MMPSHRSKPSRNILIVDLECLHEPLPKNQRVNHPVDWQWVPGSLVALQKLTKHYELSIYQHVDYVKPGELEALAHLETWFRRELLVCDILLSRIIQVSSQYPTPNHIRARLSSSPSLQSWWIGHHPASIRLGDELNMSTCLTFHPTWNREDLDKQNAVIPALISESLAHFSEEILKELVKTAATR